MPDHRRVTRQSPMRRRSVAAALVSMLLVVGVGCAASPPDRAEVVRALQTSGIPASQARCTADAIYDTLTGDQIEQLIERGNGGTPKDDPTRTDDALDKLNSAMATCRDLGTSTTTEATGSPVTTTTRGASLDTAPDTQGSTTTSPPVGSTDPPSPSSSTTR